jgi:3-phenylpropionate/trans-cinnamate dioxygenase ferredoxin reductase subunit
MSTEAETFVIVGGGQAGAWIARTLRTEGYRGRIILVGEEAHAPYERPPLSKAILTGECEADSVTLLDANAVDDLAIECVIGDAVQRIDRDAMTVVTQSGKVLSYDRLFLATGARARSLPLDEQVTTSGRAFTLRTLDDAIAIKSALVMAKSLAVIGGGWIGLEVAATARAKGLDVTVIEAGERLCARSVPVPISDFLRTLHAHAGTQIMLGCAPTDFHMEGDQICFQVGSRDVQVDLLVVGIGSVPEDSLARDAGLDVSNGIVVDDCGRTSDPAISAAGDVTMHPSVLHGGAVRLESWANAQKQAMVAARAALGQVCSYREVPWLWSDQFDCNIQMVGAPERAVTVTCDGDPATGSCCWRAADENGNLIGAVALNAPRQLRTFRKELEQAICA